jgi:hypothetical protein
MSAGVQSELASFHQFVGQQLSDTPQISPEEVLELWRTEHPTSDDFAESVAALREALADMAAGDEGISFVDFDREFRARRKLDVG